LSAGTNFRMASSIADASIAGTMYQAEARRRCAKEGGPRGAPRLAKVGAAPSARMREACLWRWGWERG